MPDIRHTLGGWDTEHWEPQEQPEGTMQKIKYGLVNDGNLCHKTGDKEGVVFCHRNHVDRCGCACAAFQVAEDKDGKKVAVLHCFPEPREIDVEFEIQEDPNTRAEREHREIFLRSMTTGPANNPLPPGVPTIADTARATGVMRPTPQPPGLNPMRDNDPQEEVELQEIDPDGRR